MRTARSAAAKLTRPRSSVGLERQLAELKVTGSNPVEVTILHLRAHGYKLSNRISGKKI